MELLYKYNDKDINKEDFKRALKKLGIVTGDTIFVHSDIMVFGRLLSKNRNKFFTCMLDSIKETVGEEGVIIMPTFSYSFCNNDIFDVENTKGTVGVLNEFFRKSKDTQRTVHPIFSCSIWGSRKNEFTNVSMDSFGMESIFDKLYKNNGKLVFLGADFHSCTYLHYIEQSFAVPYRYIKNFKGIIKDGNHQYNTSCKFYVRYLDKNVVLETNRLKDNLLKRDIMKSVKVGAGTILAVNAQKLYSTVFKLLKEDIFYLLKEPVDI
ncbi:AAC(3) family N-acetyltransferase [Clostridium tyrobutyricum]|uniref:AAC(3) family N-acetyltransferase n=1 Tax=Clostridium tyrobutyricum TaxID=1519 RepID=UPI0002D52BA1|nr:AAC(3) family N-acetyltransferase [Clostridium tyrobutyricum]